MKTYKKILYPVLLGSFLYFSYQKHEKIVRFQNITKGKIAKIIERESKIYKQNPDEIKVCAITESVNTDNPNIFQLEPETYVELSKELYDAGYISIDTTKSGVKNLEFSIKCGVKHFSRLLYKYSDNYGGNYKSYYPQIEKIISDENLEHLESVIVMALISHNRGEGNLDKWLKSGCKFHELPPITQKHLKRANRNMNLTKITNLIP